MKNGASACPDPVSLARQSTILASGARDNTVRLWDVATHTNIATLEEHTGWVYSVSFSRDGTTLASGSADGIIMLWDISPYVTSQTLAADFDGDSTVGIPDFLLFLEQFGLSQGDAGYDARYDLDGDGTIGIGDFLIFVDAFGKKVS